MTEFLYFANCVDNSLLQWLFDRNNQYHRFCWWSLAGYRLCRGHASGDPLLVHKVLYDIPNAENAEGGYTKQYFARMWYDLLIASPGFLGIVQGEDDPYTWTTGQGCGYVLAGERQPYSGRSKESILLDASRELYYIDEGESIGVVDRNLLIGDVTPPI